AAAQVAAHRLPNLPLVGRLGAQHEVARSDQHAWRAIAALQRVLARERGAQLAHDLVVVEALDRGDARALARHRIGDAGARRFAVDQDGASAAHSVLAAEMRAGEVLPFSQEIREVHPRLDRGADVTAVDDQCQRHHDANACANARPSAAIWIRCRIGSATPYVSRAARAARPSSVPFVRSKSAPASAQTIGFEPVAPMTARQTPRCGAASTAPMAWAKSPLLRHIL